MRQLKRASDLSREFLKDSDYKRLYEEVAIMAKLQEAKATRLSKGGEDNAMESLIIYIDMALVEIYD